MTGWLRDYSPSAPRVGHLKMETGNMMVFGAAAVAMTVFIVTLFTVAWVTEHRQQ
jgi:hypothetical protein